MVCGVLIGFAITILGGPWIISNIANSEFENIQKKYGNGVMIVIKLICVGIPIIVYDIFLFLNTYEIAKVFQMQKSIVQNMVAALVFVSLLIPFRIAVKDTRV